jgi:hypothetical protein
MLVHICANQIYQTPRKAHRPTQQSAATTTATAAAAAAAATATAAAAAAAAVTDVYRRVLLLTLTGYVPLCMIVEGAQVRCTLHFTTDQPQPQLLHATESAVKTCHTNTAVTVVNVTDSLEFRAPQLLSPADSPR